MKKLILKWLGIPYKQNEMKNKVIALLRGLSFNTTDQFGNKYVVLNIKDFERFAKMIDALYKQKD